MNRRIKILMMCSLLLNVFLVGIIIGHVSQRLTREDLVRRHAPALVDRLPQEKRKLVFETVQQVHRENRKIHGRIRESREKAIAALTAKAFDETAYQIEVKKVHELRGLMMKRLSEATIRLAKDFTQEEREALAEVLRHPPRPPWAGSRRHGGPPRHSKEPQSEYTP